MQVLYPGDLWSHFSNFQEPEYGENHLKFPSLPCLSLAGRLYLLPFLYFMCGVPVSLDVNCEMGQVLATL